MAFVLDASVALAWCFEDESTPFVQSIIARLESERAYAPAHWAIEVGNGLLVAERRKRVSSVKADALRGLVGELPVVLAAPPRADQLGNDTKLARVHGLTLYDALYLSLAARRAVPIATLDRELIRAAPAAGVTLLSG